MIIIVETGKNSFPSTFGGTGYKVNAVKMQNDINSSIDREFDLYTKTNLIDVKTYPIPSNNGLIKFKLAGLRLKILMTLAYLITLGKEFILMI